MQIPQGALTLAFVTLLIACRTLPFPSRTQIPKGAWFTLTLALVMFVITYTWHWGQELKLAYIRKHAVPLRDLLSIEYQPLLDAWEAGGGNTATSKKASRPPGSPEQQQQQQQHGGGGGGEKGGHKGGVVGKPARDAAMGASVAGTLGPVLRLGEGGPVVARVPGIGIYYNELLTGGMGVWL